MLQRFVQYIQQQHLFSKEQEVLLAVSGGRDSVVLCELMVQAGYHFAIAHCNFHLRPGDCDRDEQFVRNLAIRHNVKCHVIQFDTYGYAAEKHLSIEEAARVLRYDYFEQLRQKYGYDVIATGHHRDDSTETFFINLLRGTGIAGLHGIRPKQGYIVRPLLPFGRDEINAYVQKYHLSFVEDYTNAKTDYRRNKIRHQLMPLLRQMAPSIDHTMQQTISYLADVETVYNDSIENLRSQLFESIGEGKRISIEAISHLNPQATLLFELLRIYGFNITQVNDILRSLHSQSGLIFNSEQYQIILDRNYLLLNPILIKEERPIIKSEVLSRESLVTLRTPINIALFDDSKVKRPYSLRHWKDGDRFNPFGMHGSQLVSDYFVDHKFSLIQKQQTWLLVDANDEILWIVGHRADGRCAVTSKTTKVLRLELQIKE